MKKLLIVFALALMLLSVVAATPTPTPTPVCGDNKCNGAEDCNTCVADCGVCPFCTDSDGGKDIWTAGTATTDKDNYVDDCNGGSENLKEGACDANNGKFDNIQCSDYNAVCITVGDKTVPDYCACPTGTSLDPITKKCENNTVPEFNYLTALLGLVIVAGIYATMRRK